MKNSLVTLIMLAAFGFSLSVQAQCSPGSGTTTLSINGTPAAGQVVSIPVTSTTTTEISMADSVGGGALPFVLLVGTGISCQSIFLTWGGTIDLSSPQILFNGISPSSFLDVSAKTNWSSSFPTGCYWAGNTAAAFQSVCTEPTMPPLFFRETGAIQATYVANGTVTTVYNAIGDDAFVAHTLSGACGTSGSILFGGLSYSSIYISSNGPITFGTGTNGFSATTAGFFSGFSSSLPGVSPRWCDMGRNTALNDQVTVIEDAAAGYIECQFTGQEAWNSGTPLGAWSCRIANASGGSSGTRVTLDFTASLPNSSSDDSSLVGVTDGQAGGLNSILNFSTAGTLPYQTPSGSGPESICQLFPAGSFTTALLTLTDVMGNFNWTVI